MRNTFSFEWARQTPTECLDLDGELKLLNNSNKNKNKGYGSLNKDNNMFHRLFNSI